MIGQEALQQRSPNYGPRSHFVTDEKLQKTIFCRM